MENLNEVPPKNPAVLYPIDARSKILADLPPPSHELQISVSRNWNFKYSGCNVDVRPGKMSIIELSNASGEINFGSGYIYGPQGAGIVAYDFKKNKPWPVANANAFCFLVAVFSLNHPRDGLKGLKYWLGNTPGPSGGASINSSWMISENEGGPIGIACNDYHAGNNEGWFKQRLRVYENLPLDYGT